MASASSRWRWKRPSSSASSRLTPLTSFSRRIARPPTTWPSASIGRPASVVSVDGEAFAALAQRRHRAFHRLRLVGIEPQPEGEHAMRRVGVGDEADVADDLGLVVGGRPGDQDLRLRAQQRIDAVDLGPCWR